MHAADDIGVCCRPYQYLVHKVGMTIKAIIVKYSLVPFSNKDRLREILKSECFGMQKTILPFCQPLVDQVVGKMTIHASSHCVMARLLPGIVLGLHDVTIHARSRILTKIGETFPIVESESTQAEKYPHHYSDDRAPCRHALLRTLGAAKMDHKPAYHLDKK